MDAESRGKIKAGAVAGLVVGLIFGVCGGAIKWWNDLESDVELILVAGEKPDSATRFETNWWLEAGSSFDVSFESGKPIHSASIEWTIWTDYCQPSQAEWTVSVNGEPIASGKPKTSFFSEESKKQDVRWSGTFSDLRIQARRLDNSDCNLHFIVEDFGIEIEP